MRTAVAALERSMTTVVLLVLFSIAGVAHAAWLADGSGNAYSAAQWMPSGHQPTASVDGTAVTITWSSSTLSGAAITEYVVRRYANGAPSLVNPAFTCTSTCSTQDTPGTGTWQYTVTPVHDQWSGTESPLSGPVSVAPAAPTGLRATAESSSTVRLSWTTSTDSTATEPGTSEGQWVYGRTQGGTWTLLATVGLGVESYLDAELPCGTTREYYVVAYDAHGQTPSDVANATTHACAPATPTDLAVAGVTQTQISLTWSHDGATEYRIERSPDGSTWTQIGTSDTTTYADTTLSCGQTRHYRLFAHDPATGLDSSPSATVTAMTSACVAPNPPTNLTATAMAQTQIDLTWAHAGATEYRVERSLDEVTWTPVATTTTTTYSDTTVACNQTHHYRVLAHDTATGLTSSASHTAAETTPACPLVASLSATSFVHNPNNWRATITVTVTQGGVPVSGVQVVGGSEGATHACTTRADGSCPPLTTGNIPNATASITVTVDTLNGVAPDPPVSITVNRP